MSKFKITNYILLVCFLCLIACDGSNPNNTNSGFAYYNFPNAVGMYWEYEIYDSLTSTYDTVQVSITDETTFNDLEPMLLKKTKYPADFLNHIVSEYYHLENNKLHIYSDEIGQDFIEYFQFPIQLNSAWASNAYDSSFVTDTGFISVPAGDFGTSYKIERDWMLDFEGGGNHTETWLVPNVGLVQKHILKQYSDGQTLYTTTNEVWKLIDYNLYTFAQDEFPNTVGSWWRYETFDPNRSSYDTLTVEIIDEIIFGEDTVASLWQYESSFFNDTLIVHNKGNYTVVRSDTLGIWESHTYTFPFAIGRRWNDSLIFFGGSEIFDKDSVTVPAGSFKNGFRYFHQQNGYNSAEYISEWLVPEIGMVKRIWVTHNLGPGFHVELSLIDYRIR